VSIDRILQLKLVTDVGDINSKMASTTTEVGKVSKAFSTLTSFAGPIAITAVLAGVDMVAKGLQGGIEDARKFNDAVSGLAGTLLPLGIGAAAAQLLAENAAAAGAALGFADDDELVRGLQVFAQMTKDAAESQVLLGLAMDLARLKGIPLEEAVGKVAAIYKGSGKTLKEFGLAGVEGMEAVNQALGANTGFAVAWAATTQGQYATTAAAIDDAWQTLGTVLTQIMDEVILPAISKLLPIIGELWATWQPILADLGAKFGEIIGKMLEVWGKLQPAFQKFADFVGPLFENIGLVIATGVEVVSGLLDTIIALLNGDFTGAFKAIQTTVDSVVENIMRAIGNLVGFLSGIAETVLGVARGVGNAIFNGISEGVNKVVGMVQGVVNSVLRVWNSMDPSIPSGSFQFWGPGSFGIPNPFGGYIAETSWPAMAFNWAGSGDLIPDLAQGGIIKKRPGGMLARIGEGMHDEAVIPLDGRHGLGGGSTYNINVNVAPGGDMVATGKAIVEAIRQYERRSGAVWRS
jgi:hypothetical protein